MKTFTIITFALAGTLFAVFGESKDIFVVNKAPVFSFEEASRLFRTKSSPEKIARTLARTQDQSQSVNGIKIEELLTLNSYELDKDCHSSEVSKRNDICKKLDWSGEGLASYCKECVAVLKKDCKANMRSILESTDQVDFLGELIKKVDSYIEKNNVSPRYPLDLAVIDFLYTIDSKEKAKLQKSCTTFNIKWKEQLNAFDLSFIYDTLNSSSAANVNLQRAIQACRASTAGKLA